MPSVELECASANAALPAKNVAVNAANERLRLLISFSPESLFISICGCRRSRPDEATEINDTKRAAFRISGVNSHPHGLLDGYSTGPDVRCPIGVSDVGSNGTYGAPLC